MNSNPLMKERARKRFALIVPAVVLASVLVSCSGAGPQQSIATGGTPVPGGTLRMTIGADEGCVDPQQNLGRTQLVVGRAMVDSLVYQEPDSGKFQPWLADSWTISPDGKSYTFTLRNNVTFSDGTSLTAQTVKDNLDAIVALGAKARLASTYLVGYSGTTVVSDLVAQVNFTSPNAAFLQAVSTPSMGLISSKSTSLSQADRCLGRISGSGPFVLDGYEHNQLQKLTKRKTYDWAPKAMHQGAPYLDSVEISIVPESGVRTGSLGSGQSDLMMEVSKADVATLKASALPIESRSNPGIPQELFVNPTKGVLTDIAVRQALQLGVDRSTIVKATLTEYNTVATGALSSTTPGFVDLSAEMGYNPDKAAKVLQDAGWVPGPDGIRVKNGQRLTMTLLYGSQLYGPLIPLMELAQADLAKIGVGVTLRPLPDADANAAWAKGDYELRFSGLTRGDPDALRTAYFGLDPKLDKLLIAQASESNIESRMKMVADVQSYVISNGISVPLNELSLPLAHQPTVRNISFTADSLLLLHEISMNQ